VVGLEEIPEGGGGEVWPLSIKKGRRKKVDLPRFNLLEKERVGLIYSGKRTTIERGVFLCMF